MALTCQTLTRVLLSERSKLLAYITCIVRDNHLAEDIFQEVFILALDKREEIESEQHLCGWFRQAARFRSLKALRATARMPQLLQSPLLELLENDWRRLDDEDEGMVKEALATCLGKLSPQARRLVALRYVEGLDCGTLATNVGRTVNGIYVSLSRIHRRLARCIQKRLASGGG